jgi:5-formyltetrahydrofolate cyclo-ligase
MTNQTQTLAPHLVSTLRSEIRQTIRQRRRTLTDSQQHLFAEQAALRMLAYPPVKAARSVAVFLSFDGELDTRPLIHALWQAGKAVYLPVLHPFSKSSLLFLRYDRDSHLVMNRLKILEPKLNVRHVLPLDDLDVLITPLVAFDERGQRLGMGGGFYDRTLQHWRQHNLWPVGLAHDCQRVPTLPAEEWDIPLPAVVTPSRMWEWDN